MYLQECTKYSLSKGEKSCTEKKTNENTEILNETFCIIGVHIER